jgi:hypothetical protein
MMLCYCPPVTEGSFLIFTRYRFSRTLRGKALDTLTVNVVQG